MIVDNKNGYMNKLNFSYPKLEELNAATGRSVYIENKYPEFWQYLSDKYQGMQVSFIEKLYMFYHNIDKPRTCPMCGKRTKFLSLHRGYREFCSHDCSNACPDIQERKKQTSLKNYGTEYPMHSKEVREKLKNSVMEKYGVKNPFQSKELMQKSRKTCLEKYGTEYANQSQQVIEKIRNAKQQNVFDKYDNIISIEYTDNIGTYIMKCPDENCTICEEKQFKIKSSILYDRNRLKVDICTIRTPIGAHIKNTTLEVFIKSILDTYNISYIENDRKILKGKELDIYIPEKKIGIECNGVYWHSQLESNYHYQKWKDCKEQGIQLLTIWEDWITNKPKIVESIVLSKLGIYQQKIGARQCELKTVPSNEARKFLDENHIQGFCNSNLKLGLYYKGELVSLMTFNKSQKHIFENKACWELTRFCTKMNTRVINGAERLLKHFLQEYEGNVVSYASHDISNGNLYKKLGFNFERETMSCYWYVHNQTHKRYHRSNFMKGSLVKQGYDPNLTEEQIMIQTDYLKIYDSGMDKYVLTRT